MVGTAHALRELRPRLDGESLVKDSPGYAHATRTFNGRRRHLQPAIVVQCASSRDVRESA
ncbi:hypothetical protein [Pseudarthrobacter sp. H2]|uniref:hypothetical protein n=1 Tax=Pseudarthrobacter sp. H2 TaxID=3418415 RepID=UPI003CFA6632